MNDFLPPSRVVDVGSAFAVSSVNSTIWRRHGLFTTRDGFQYFTWFKDHCTLAVGMRRDGPVLAVHDLPGPFRLRDSHEAATLGVDAAGYIHLAYDNHASTIRYRRSVRPADISTWTDEIVPPPLERVTRLTYASFLGSDSNRCLRLLYRNGDPRLGHLEYVDLLEPPDRWSAAATRVVDGKAADQPYGPYFNSVGEDESTLVFGLTWRKTSSFKADAPVVNLDFAVLRSDDFGVTWSDGRGRRIELPARRDNLAPILAIDESQSIMNQAGGYLCPSGRMHFATYFRERGGSGPRHLRHIWEEKTSGWHCNEVAVLPEFELRGLGTLQLPVSRPQVLADRDSAVIVYRQPWENGFAFFATLLFGDGYSKSHTWRLTENDIGMPEPVIDVVRWRRTRTLSMWVQRCDQRQWLGDLASETTANASICEWDMPYGLGQ